MSATVVVIPWDQDNHVGDDSSQRVRVVIHVNAEMVASDRALHEARAWLAKHVTPHAGVAEPELVIDEDLFWRFQVTLNVPNEAQPGSGTQYSVGHMRLKAVTGEIENGDALAAELHAAIASITP
jgi:hypothetical protein